MKMISVIVFVAVDTLSQSAVTGMVVELVARIFSLHFFLLLTAVLSVKR